MTCLVPQSGLKYLNTSCRGVAQPGSAPALGAGGRRFKSYRPDQSFQVDKLHFCFSVYSVVGKIVGGHIFLSTFLLESFQQIGLEVQDAIRQRFFN